MATKYPETDEQTIRTACIELTSEDTSSANFVKLSDVKQHPEVQDNVELADGESPRKVGKILADADWAEKWSRGTYMIET